MIRKGGDINNGNATDIEMKPSSSKNLLD